MCETDTWPCAFYVDGSTRPLIIEGETLLVLDDSSNKVLAKRLPGYKYITKPITFCDQYPHNRRVKA